MNLKQAFAIKDQMIQQALMAEFSDDAATITKIEKAFKTGEANWRPHARAIFGRKADQFFAKLDKT